MATARTIRKFLEEHHVRSDMLPHPLTARARDSAEAAHVEAECVAKAVMVGDEHGLMMAVVPASHYVKMKELRRLTGRQLHFVHETDFAAMFPDCETGAIPPLGEAYDMQMVWDDCLAEQSDIYFEAGDHENLMHVSAHDFVDMYAAARTAASAASRTSAGQAHAHGAAYAIDEPEGVGP